MRREHRKKLSWLKAFPQVWHMNGRSPECTRKWFCSWNVFLNDFVQNWQMSLRLSLPDLTLSSASSQFLSPLSGIVISGLTGLVFFFTVVVFPSQLPSLCLSKSCLESNCLQHFLHFEILGLEGFSGFSLVLTLTLLLWLLGRERFGFCLV